MPRTLGMLGTGLVTFMQNRMWQGAVQAAREHDARLVFFPTISLSSWPPFPPQTKVLFDLVDGRYIDGLVVWYAGIVEGLGVREGQRFFDRYGSLPLVTIGGKLADRPDLSIDNYRGVRAAVEHLIADHQRLQIAVIRGPEGHPDADERYRAYADALRAHDLPVRPGYVAEALFELQSAARSVEAIIVHWLRDLRLEIDAVVTASDYMALAAIKAIEACGRRVPEDIAVAGFDDVEDSRAGVPSLTTVRQPFFEMGRRAVELLLGLMDGRTPPHRSLFPAPLVRRESCGCLTISPPGAGSAVPPGAASAADRSRSLAELRGAARDAPLAPARLEELLGAWRADAASAARSAPPADRFLGRLRQELVAAIDDGFDAAAWQRLLTALRAHVMHDARRGRDAAGESVFSQARLLVAELAQRAHIRQRIKAERQGEHLRQISEALITAFGNRLLADTLCEQLPQLGFPGFYLALYEHPAQPSREARLILAYENGARVALPPEGVLFPTGRLTPENSPPRAEAVVVEPLYFRDEQLGILVLEAGPVEGPIYENLRAQVSSALQGSRLLTQVRQHADQLERGVAQLASANGELEAFSYSVSHDLRAPLRAIDGFSGILLEEFQGALPEGARAYVDHIREHTRRMGDLIDGLLSFSHLGRDQLRRELVDTRQLIEEILADLRMAGDASRVTFVVDETLPTSRADRSMLRQVWINLIANAVKYSGKGAQPRVEIGHTLRENRVVFTVKDNGVGFDMRYADRLFGVFQRLHRTEDYEGTGIGLAIVKRIVERHGGRVWAEAEPGHGAMFFFVLD
jgi:signal transduction histidine kinase/DNA-binding LacI/PurR family transcriptional regulator